MDEMILSKKRRNFLIWKVEQIYMAQDGVCMRCRDSLERGLHRYCKDGSHANNSIGNLEPLLS